MNKERIEEVMKEIEAVPERLAMDTSIQQLKNDFFTLVSGFSPDSFLSDGLWVKAPACNTIGCFAGWAVFKFSHFLLNNDDRFAVGRAAHWGDVQTAACEILDLTEDEAMTLFHVEQWPKELQEPYLRAKTQAARVALLRKRVNLFVQEEQA